jgi:hypothetical protein
MKNFTMASKLMDLPLLLGIETSFENEFDPLNEQTCRGP